MKLTFFKKKKGKKDLSRKNLIQEPYQHKLLKDQAFWKSLNKDGVVKIPFLNESQIDELRNFYNEIHPDGTLPKVYDNIYMTSWCSDRKYKYRIKDKVDKVFTDPIAALFEEYRVLNQLFIVKNPGNETTFNIHQDWSVVDEEQFPSLNIWVPLYDVDESSGAMWIIKKSHLLQANLRGAGTLFPNYKADEELLKPYMSNFPMKAGEALIFFHSTIHGSPPNLSEKQRIVAVASIVPKSAPLRINYLNPGGDTIEVFQPEDDFAFNYKSLREESVFTPPKGQLVDKIPLKGYQPLSIEEIIKTLD